MEQASGELMPVKSEVGLKIAPDQYVFHGGPEFTDAFDEPAENAPHIFLDKKKI